MILNILSFNSSLERERLMKELIVGSSLIRIIQGDITREQTDAIVNAANPALRPGGGVSGSIHRAAGPKLWEECKTLGGCKTGEANITKGYQLKAPYVIHTVGPVYSGSKNDRILLASCYTNSLYLAQSYKLKSISFPAISTGIFGYPLPEAAEVSLRAVKQWLEQHDAIELVQFVLYDETTRIIFETVLKEIS